MLCHALPSAQLLTALLPCVLLLCVYSFVLCDVCSPDPPSALCRPILRSCAVAIACALFSALFHTCVFGCGAIPCALSSLLCCVSTRTASFCASSPFAVAVCAAVMCSAVCALPLCNCLFPVVCCRLRALCRLPSSARARTAVRLCFVACVLLPVLGCLSSAACFVVACALLSVLCCAL